MIIMCLNALTFPLISNWGKQHFLEGDQGAWWAMICLNAPWPSSCCFSLGFRTHAEPYGISWNFAAAIPWPLSVFSNFFWNVWAKFCFMWDMVVLKPAFGTPNSKTIGRVSHRYTRLGSSFSRPHLHLLKLLPVAGNTHHDLSLA